jgi:hypothetical protein
MVELCLAGQSGRNSEKTILHESHIEFIRDRSRDFVIRSLRRNVRKTGTSKMLEPDIGYFKTAPNPLHVRRALSLQKERELT